MFEKLFHVCWCHTQILQYDFWPLSETCTRSEPPFSIVMTTPAIVLSRELVFAIGVIMTILTSGGLVLGFGPIYTQLVNEQQWHELCPAKTPASEVCSDQEIQLQSVFSTGFLSSVIGQTILGVSLDLFGPRYTSVGSSMISIIGNIFMAIGNSQDGTDNLIVAGYALIAFGGMGMLLSTLQLAELFSKPSMYCAIVVAAYYASGYIYVLLAIPIDRAPFFKAYAIVVAVCAAISYVIFPVQHIWTASPTTPISGLRWIKPHVDVSKFKGLWKGLKHHLKRRDFWCYITIGSMTTLINVFVSGAFPSIIKQIVPNDASLRNQYTNSLFPVITNSSFVFAPLTGFIIDRFGFRIAGYMTLAQFVVLCGVITLPYLSTQVVSFVVLAMALGSLTSIQYAYIMACYPSKLYGLLTGVVTLIVFIFCLLTYALTSLAQNTFHGNNNYVFLILAIPTIACILLIRFLYEVGECDEKQTLLLDSSDADEVVVGGIEEGGDYREERSD